MSKLLLLLMATVLWAAPGTRAQTPGAYPHLVLSDSLGTSVPGPGGPFDNSGVFPAFSGLSFKAQVTYKSAGQATSNVLWALLVSVNKTPLPTNVTPPPLLTMPPFLLLIPTPANLTAGGFGELPLYVPAGVYSAQTYVQGLVYDVTSVPQMRLTNGLTVTVEVPKFSVNLAFVRSKPAGGDGQMRDVGVIDIGPETLNTLKPIGTQAPPQAIPAPAPLTDDYRFMPILPNVPAEPVNPLARPFTRVTGAVTATATTIPVGDTSAFPTRGRVMIAFQSSNLWAVKDNGGQSAPNVEVVAYEGTTPTSFLNCQRSQLGSRGSNITTGFAHVANEVVLGFFTMASTASAKLRTEVALDADNRDMPHVVIPPFTFDAGGDVGIVTRDLDLYMYETLANKVQGFMLLDRLTGTWRAIPGTEKNQQQGRWNPMVAISPDGRSMIAHLQIPGGIFGWDNAADGLFAIRLDGLPWPATGSETWMIPYQVTADPINTLVTNIRSRRLWMPATAIIGPDPDNYVAYVALAHKWKQTTVDPGGAWELNVGTEAEYAREEIIVRDYVECPLTPPGSSKSLPSSPRPYITGSFVSTGQGVPIIRFDPDAVTLGNKTRLLVTAGGSETLEDVFIIRNLSVSQAGVAVRSIINVTGYTNLQESVQETAVRPFAPGGHGIGSKVAESPDGTRVAFVFRDKKNQGIPKKDWLNIALTNGGSYSKVNHIYADSTDVFKEAGPLQSDRAISGLRFIDNTRLIFMMGLNKYDDPFGATAALAPQMDWFVYDLTNDLMTNLTKTGNPAGNGFATLGVIAPASFFSSPNGEYEYLIRAGGIGSTQFSTNPSLLLPAGTPVTNILGLNTATLDVFPITGTEIDGSALVGNLTLATTDLAAPVETVSAMNFVAGSGVQDGLVYYTAHRANGNGSDDVFALDRDAPFVTFAATATTKIGVHVTCLAPDPYSGLLAFSRTGTSDPVGATQHPFVVDLENFLFERDLLPTYVVGGVPIGRVMPGSFHFIPPSGSASDALVFSFGLVALNGGIPGIATPAYYPLSAVSDLLAEPIPVLIPLVDTFLLGTDYRFYVEVAGK
jgi:hypothetical protein